MNNLRSTPTPPQRPSTPNAELAAFSASSVSQARRVLVRLFRPPELFNPAPQRHLPPPIAISSARDDQLTESRPPSPDPLPVYTADPSAGEQVLDHNSRRRRRRAVTESYALEQEQRREIQLLQRGRPVMRRRGYSVESVFYAATAVAEGAEFGDEGEGLANSRETVEGDEAVTARKLNTRVFVLPLYEGAMVIEHAVESTSRPTMGKRKWSWAGGLRARDGSAAVQVQ